MRCLQPVRHLALATCFGILSSSVARSANQDLDNAALTGMFTSDQTDCQIKPIDWAIVKPRDEARRQAATSLIRSGAVKTAGDYYHAAMIFQHGPTVDDIRTAFALAQIAATLDPGAADARWLTAAAWDRILVRSNAPQWYGTQFTRSETTGLWDLYPVDESRVSDDERRTFNVATLTEQRKAAAAMNQAADVRH